MLIKDQIIKYDGGLWRVDYTNQSRAYILPLGKRQVVLDGATFEASDKRGVSISPDAIVEVVSDGELSQDLLDQIAIAKLEREIAALKAEEARQAAKAAAKAGKAVNTPDAKRSSAPKGEGQAREKEAQTRRKNEPLIEGYQAAPINARGAGWHLVGTVPPVIPDSLKAKALEIVANHPGFTTRQVADKISGWNASAVAACLDRFRKAGVMIAILDMTTQPGLEKPTAAPRLRKAKQEAKPVEESTDF